MSYADKVFKEMCQDIIANGTDTQGEKVRPHWEDGTPAYTIKKFGVCNRYDLRKEFPALTLRKTYIKSAVEEILWIWQEKSNNVNDLKPRIWDSWADENGSIGKAYGYQIAETYAHHKINIPEGVLATGYVDDVFENLRAHYPSVAVVTMGGESWVHLDQIDAVLYDLKNNPYSRRIITNIYNHRDLCAMRLHPCAYSMTFNVTKEEGCDKLILNAVLNQRSQDVLAANNWNVVQYSILLMMIAQSCDMIAGELVHMIADAHIYDRHVAAIEELLGREEFPAPKVTLNPEIKNFYDFKAEDVIVEDYQAGEQIKDIPIAV